MLINNLYVWTKYTGQDPEISMSNSDPFAIGYDDARIPRSWEFTVTFNVTF
ncbi:MAG: hypothetical protein LUD15_08545 [Bacteroides sp.]|nr:hypothetical protein [Bacteroides sp.]